MNRWRLAIGSVAILVASCTATASVPATRPATAPTSPSPEPRTSEATAIVPWSSETPAPVAPPTPTPVLDAPACRADQLDAGDAGWAGATGSLLGGFLIWNTSSEPCRLEGRPSVGIVDAAGRPLDVTAVPAPSPSARPILLGPRQPVPLLNQEAPGGLASETLQWFNWCGPSPKQPLSLTVTLPEDGVLHVPVVFFGGGGTPRCDAPTARSEMTVAAFDETPGPSPTEPPSVPAESLRLTLVVPDHTVAGQTLDYVAILTNQTADPIALDPCPS